MFNSLSLLYISNAFKCTNNIPGLKGCIEIFGPGHDTLDFGQAERLKPVAHIFGSASS